MFRENSHHIENDLFSQEGRLPKRVRKNLENHWSTIFYSKIFSQVKEEDFSVIYAEQFGRPNFAVNILICLEIIKELFRYTDEDLYDKYFFDYAIQRALGISNISEYDFSIRTWYNFRANLAKYEYENNVDLLLGVFKNHRDSIIEELGIRTEIQRIDSVMIAANIKKMNRLMLFHKVLSNLVKLLNKKDYSVPIEIKELVKEDEDSISFRLPSDKVPRTTLTLAESLVKIVAKYKNDKEVAFEKAFEDAERLLEEQCKVEIEKRKRGKWQEKIKLKEGKEISSGSMQNPADVDATYRKKREKEHQGYSTHASETCDPDNKMQVITMVDTVQNNIDDSVVGVEKLAELEKETELDTLIHDGGYHSPKMSEKAEALEVETIATAIRGRKPKDEILNTEHFKFNEIGLIEKCPAGESPIKQKKKDGILTVSFDKRICSLCTLRDQCIAYLSEKQSRLIVDANRHWLDKRANDSKSERFLELCRMRPAVEGLMEKLKPRYLNGRTMFRGLKKVQSRMILRAMGLNFRRYVVYCFLFMKDFYYFLTFYSKNFARQDLCEKYAC